jgi:hypothetical protein
MNLTAIPAHVIETYVAPKLDVRDDFFLSMALGLDYVRHFSVRRARDIILERRKTQTDFILGDTYISSADSSIFTITYIDKDLVVFRNNQKIKRLYKTRWVETTFIRVQFGQGASALMLRQF